ncbi:hypothetical protein HK105_201248 [Polyrhizophydium stewartii]|uniref:P-loop containing nucleoside triphosphate hydrolase protein n=1 Tax=Polyrhizophydium stewartii TaxID=2732419 RepID=A0ABR4NHG9_9FUNG
MPTKANAHASRKVLAQYRAQLDTFLSSPPGSKSTPHPSLLRALLSAAWPSLLAMTLLKAANITLDLVSPVLIPEVIKILSPVAGETPPFINNGYGLAAFLFAALALSSLSSFVFASIALDLNIWLQSSMIGALYSKSLVLSPRSRQKFTEGKLNTLIMSDSVQVADIFGTFTNTWAVLVQLSMAMYLISKYLGVSFLTAVGFICLVLVSQVPVASRLGKAFGKVMTALDNRTKILREFLYGIKIIKYQALEEAFFEKLLAARAQQLKYLASYYNTESTLVVAVFFLKIFTPIITFITYSSLGNSMDGRIIFPAYGLFQNIFLPLEAAPNLIGLFLKASVSYKRISEFMLAEEVKPDEVSLQQPASDSPDGIALKMSAASFTWEEVKKDDPKAANTKPKRRIFKKKKSKESQATLVDNGSNKKDGDAESDKPAPFALQDISLEIPRGSLVAVVGSVGSGKSSFLSALIGGMRKTAGNSALFGSVAYCAQEPWILTGSIEENIVFGDDSVRARVPAAVTAACLDRDLEILPNGLGTQIGEKGINLSGGQKARVALARAIARDADIYLLDDPIAALDAHVGKKVFDDAICGVLRGKTVFLVTHQLHLLPKVDMVVVLDEGRIVETGAFRELMAREDGALAEIMKDYHFDDAETEAAKEAGEREETEEGENGKPEDLAKAVKSLEKAVAEERRVGNVSFKTFKSYFDAGSKYFMPVMLFLGITLSGAYAGSQLLLSFWSEHRWGWSDSQFLKVYVAFTISCTGVIVVPILYAYNRLFNATRAFHDRTLAGLIKAPMSFFDTQPIGRIINRMTTDINGLDNGMVGLFLGIYVNIVAIFTAMIVISYSNVLMLAQFAVLGAFYGFIFRFYQKSNRELKRLTSIMQSPLTAHVSESLSGIQTVKAYALEDVFVAKQELTLDMRNVSSLVISNAQYWAALRLDILTSTLTFSLVALGTAGLVSPNAIGISLTSSMQVGWILNGAFLTIGTFEASLQFNAVERLDHYAFELPAEAARELPADPKDDEWPTAGAVSIRDLEIRYPSRPDHAVIQDLSLDIQPGEKVGVVGRTGSGKSTLMAALFRVMEASKGSIAIDGVDIALLGLKTLRSRLQIIPQEPVLFKGTVRSNLDFAGKYTDDELWAVLGLVGLKDFVGSLDGKLDAAIEENGANLSMGQRQLMCLCKAILAKPKVLIMDEATASVDAEADKRIQESIETQFAATTVLSIAHRLNTIAAFDRVLVLDGGRIAEFDPPHVLLGRSGSVFGDMVDATGAANAAVIRQIAADHFVKTH